MSLHSKRLDSIRLEDLQRLVENSVGESKLPDFIMELHLDNKDSKKNLVHDVIAFANSQGGDLVIGVDEKDGFASEICGMCFATNDEKIM